MYGKNILFNIVVSRNIRHKSNSTKKLLQFLADMPKANSVRIGEAQRQRQNISKKSEKYGSSTVYLQVLGSGARGAPNTLYLFTDQKRYLFNCGECTQRLAHEHKVKLSKLDHVFITTKTWRNIGGLPGLSLTLQDVGVPNITLHGPEGLDELYNATKRFVIMRDMNVTMAKCSPSKDFEDNMMSVKYVLLGLDDSPLIGKDLKPPAKRPKIEDKIEKEFEEFIHDETDYYRHEARTVVNKNSKYNDKAKLKPTTGKENMTKSEKVLSDLQKKSQCSVAYICTLKKRLGTLDLSKCVDMGVPPGPLLGQLKAGHDVVLPDGKLVLSKDVKTPDDPGPVFIVLEVPELSYLKESEFSEHFANDQNPPENVPTLIVHYTPPHVFHHPRYSAFMALFGPNTKHLVLNEQNSCLGSEAVHRTQHKLHLLDPDIFPLLRDASVAAEWNAAPPLPKTNSPARLKGLEDLKMKIALAQFQNIINMEESCKGDGRPASASDEPDKAEVIAGHTLTIFHLRPKKQLDRSAEPKLHIQEYIQETMDMDGFVDSLEQFRQLADGLRYAKRGCNEYPKVVFLGTGSCIPSKTRNTSSLVIQVDENRSMLLDCGEGTFGQLVRFYGPNRIDAFLRTLKAVYVSHLHADHHIGLIGIIQARRQAFEHLEAGMTAEPLYLLAPGQIVSWLSVYDQQFERIRPEFTLIPNQNLLVDSAHHNTDMTSAVLASIGVQRITTCLVSHCPNAFGVAIDLDGTHKLTYSGDTIPCDQLVKIGKDSTLLIHEATMEDELAEEARIKMHSTTTQAIDIGRQMNAKYTVLTHFSQRYARLPRLNANILNDNKTVGIAFDNMQITMSDLEVLPHMYAPLQLMFAEHCVEMELKAASRARLKERRPSPPGKSGDVRGSRSVTPSSRAEHTLPRRGLTKYRESNASRLRQELKGMTVLGTLRSPRARSTTSSPSKIPGPTIPRSARSASCTMPRTCRDHVDSLTGSPTANVLKSSEVCAPILISQDRPSNKLRRPLPSLSYQDEARSLNKRQNSVDTLTTRRTVSNVSNMSRGSERVRVIGQHSTSQVVIDSRTVSNVSNMSRGSERVRVIGQHSTSQVVIDTRSKTLSSVSRRPTGEEVMSIIANKGKCPAKRQCESSGSGYGKPLVTSFNKKLTIMRNNKLLKQNVEADQLSPVRSPDRSVRTKNANVSNGNKLRGSPADAAEKTSQAARPLRSTSLTRYEKSPTRSTGFREDTRVYASRRLRPQTGTVEYQSTDRTNFTGGALNKDRVSFKDKKPIRKPFAPLPDMVIDRLKQPLCKKNLSAPSPTARPSSKPYNNKTYKPQLEDITSSYLLLNQYSQEKVKDEGKSISPHATFAKKSKPLDDEQRRRKLKEVTQKYRKYDKIEGLNWIPWK